MTSHNQPEDKTCETCKAPLEGDAIFCLRCGNPQIIGQMAGVYQITTRIGSGGMGMVYLAEHKKLKTPFAIKVLHKALADKPEIAKRFLQEAETTSKLRHEHIVFLADYGEIPGVSPYIAMEFLDGLPLSKVLKRDPILPFHRTFAILEQICETMSYAHSQRVIHRDLKPDNLFLLKREEGQRDFLKILDFGIAKSLGSKDAKLTKVGSLLGTPQYAAPEQVLGEEIDHRADVFAVGVLFFRMLTGTPPYKGDSTRELLSQRLLSEAPLLSSIHPAWKSSPIENLLQGALRVDKNHRLPSMQAFLSGLRSGLASALAIEKEVSPTTDGASNSGGLSIPTKELPSETPPSQWKTRTPVPSDPSEISDPSAQTSHTPPPSSNASSNFRKILGYLALLTALLGGATALYFAFGKPSGSTEPSSQNAISSTPPRPLTRPTPLVRPRPLTPLTPLTPPTPLTPLTPPTPPTPKSPSSPEERLTSKGVSPLPGALAPSVGSAERSAVRPLSASQTALPPALQREVVPLPAYPTQPLSAPMVRVNQGVFLYSGGLKRLTLPEFYIDQFEVTVGEYKRCPTCSKAPLQRRTYDRPNLPLVAVEWAEARAFCQWAGKDLPTEPQWEKAARGSLGFPFPWGNDNLTCKYANGPKCARRLLPVGPGHRDDGKSPWGAYDLIGNAAEWTLGCRSQTYEQKTLHKVIDSCDRDRVTRGGGFKSNEERLNSIYRRAFYRNQPDVGFRCAWLPKS